MSKIWQTLLPTMLAILSLNLIKEAELFEQTNVLYTAFVRNYDAVDADVETGAIGLPNHVTIQRAPIEMIKPAQLQHTMDADELAPLLLELLKQIVPNWQQSQQQQQQQQQQQRLQQQQPQHIQQQKLQQQAQMHKQQQQRQHFFVYENPQAVRLASQQPQILPEFNGVNVHQAQQYWQQQPQTVTLPQQQKQQQFQYAQLPMPIHLQQQQQQYLKYFQTAPKISSAPPATATATATIRAGTPTASRATQPPAEGSLAPIGTLTSGFQTDSTEAEYNSPGSLCPQQAGTPCSCCNTTPLLGVALLKVSVG